jgi:ADP-ribose pyrophosphatase
MTRPLTSLRTTTVYAGSKLTVEEEQVRLPTGKLARHVTVRHPGAVVFIPRRDDGALLVLSQYRHSVRQSLLEFPAGTLERGEEPLACAQREIAEEVGHTAAHWEPLGKLYPAPGFCDEVQHGFFATGLTPCEAEPDDDEIIEVVPMPSADVLQAIQSGAMMDGKSIALYFRAQLRGLL